MKPTAFAGVVVFALGLLMPARGEAVSPQEFANQAALSDMFESESQTVREARNESPQRALSGTTEFFTVEKGRHYRAQISLGPLQSSASNKIVADKFREVGFTNVAVTGNGRTRYARGLWPHDDAAAVIPSEISHIE